MFHLLTERQDVGEFGQGIRAEHALDCRLHSRRVLSMSKVARQV